MSLEYTISIGGYIVSLDGTCFTEIGTGNKQIVDMIEIYPSKLKIREKIGLLKTKLYDIDQLTLTDLEYLKDKYSLTISQL